MDCPAIVPKGMEEHQALLPRLAILRGLTLEERLALVARAEAYQRAEATPLLSALLESAAAPAQVVRYLAKQMVHKTSFGASFLLRYYDPLVFRHLRWIFNARQLATLLGSAKAWYHPTPDGSCWYRQGVPTYPAEMKPVLSKEQWGSLHRIGLINAVVTAATRDSLLSIADNDVFERVDQYLRMAIEDAGLMDACDQKCYALQALRFGPDRLTEAGTLRKIARSKAEGLSYVGLCMEDG